MSRTTPENIEKIREKIIATGHGGLFVDDKVEIICSIIWTAIDLHKGRDSTQLALKKQGKLIKNRSGTHQEHGNLIINIHDQLNDGEDETHES